jgi:PPOX class probable F420-dependent enzyme
MSIGDRLAAASNRFYLRIRHPEAWRTEASAQGFDALAGHKYCLLITFRRSGEPVPTPVWFGLDDGKVYFRSEAEVGKIKRIRNEPRALVGPCNFRGRPLGPMAVGRARVLPSDGADRAEAALQANYGLGRRLYEGSGERLGLETVYVEVAPA